MYKLFIDDTLFYSPEIAENGYALSSAVLKQALNKVDTLTFTMPPTHPMYDEIYKFKSEVILFRDTTCIFVGRIIDMTRNMYNMVTVYCESILGMLNDIIYHHDSWQNFIPEIVQTPGAYPVETQSPSDPDQQSVFAGFEADFSPADYADTVLENSRSTNTSILRYHPNRMYSFDLNAYPTGMDANRKVDIRNYYFPKPAYAHLSELISEYGGYLIISSYVGADYLVDPEAEKIIHTYVDEETGEELFEYTQITANIDWRQNGTGSSGNQTIQFANNLIDFVESSNSSNLFTALHPTAPYSNIYETLDTSAAYRMSLIGYEASDVNSRRGDYVPNPTLINDYGYIVRNVEYDDVVNSAYELYLKIKRDQDYQSPGIFNISFSIKAIDLNVVDSTLDALQAGYFASFLSTPHGINQNILCSADTIDLLDPTKSTYTFGAAIESITANLNSVQSKNTSKFNRTGQ